MDMALAVIVGTYLLMHTFTIFTIYFVYTYIRNTVVYLCINEVPWDQS